MGCYAAEAVAIPAYIGGLDVVRVELGADSLTEICRELVISEGIAEADIDLSAAPGLATFGNPVVFAAGCSAARLRVDELVPTPKDGSRLPLRMVSGHPWWD